jgi:hypothetical protein
MRCPATIESRLGLRFEVIKDRFEFVRAIPHDGVVGLQVQDQLASTTAEFVPEHLIGSAPASFPESHPLALRLPEARELGWLQDSP